MFTLAINQLTWRARAMLSDMYKRPAPLALRTKFFHVATIRVVALHLRSSSSIVSDGAHSIINIRHDLNAFHDHASPFHKCVPSFSWLVVWWATTRC